MGKTGSPPPPAHMAPCPQVGRCGRGVRPGVQTGATLSRQMGGCGRTRVVSVVCTSLCIQLLTPHTQDKTQMCGDSHASGSLRARQQQQQLQPNKDQTRCRHGDMPTSWARVTEPAGGSVPKIDTARATSLHELVCVVGWSVCGGEGIFPFSFFPSPPHTHQSSGYRSRSSCRSRSFLATMSMYMSCSSASGM